MDITGSAQRKRWDSLLEDYYFAYSVERVGTLQGLSDAEWYDTIAKRLVTSQEPDGRWRRKRGRLGMGYGDRNQVYETSLAMLCLARATRHPITPKRPGKATKKGK